MSCILTQAVFEYKSFPWKSQYQNTGRLVTAVPVLPIIIYWISWNFNYIRCYYFSLCANDCNCFSLRRAHMDLSKKELLYSAITSRIISCSFLIFRTYIMTMQQSASRTVKEKIQQTSDLQKEEWKRKLKKKTTSEKQDKQPEKSQLRQKKIFAVPLCGFHPYFFPPQKKWHICYMISDIFFHISDIFL